MITFVLISAYLAFMVFVIAAMWRVYEKAGKPGWAVLIPIYNIIVLLEIVKKPLWWIVLFLIPIVNVVAAFMVCIELAKAFGKTAGFGVGLTLLGFIFYPILGYGDAQYQGDVVYQHQDILDSGF